MIVTQTTFTPAQVAAYLDRLGHDGPASPTVETLHAIDRAHRLRKDRLITFIAGEREERVLRDEDVPCVLWDVFGIDLQYDLHETTIIHSGKEDRS